MNTERLEMSRRDFIRAAGYGTAGLGLTFWSARAALGNAANYKNARDAAGKLVDVVKKRYETLAEFLAERDKAFAPVSLRSGGWTLETPSLTTVSSELSKGNRTLFSLYKETRGARTHIGSFFGSDHVRVKELGNGGMELISEFPHVNFNLTSGGKLKPGLWKGIMKIVITPDAVVMEHDLVALADSDDFNIGLMAFDPYELDDAYIWQAQDGGWIGKQIDLGVDFQIKDLSASVTCPEWADKPDNNKLLVITRGGLGLRIKTEDLLCSGAETVENRVWHGNNITEKAGNHWRLDTGQCSANVEYKNIKKGAKIKIKRVIEAFEERNPGKTPPDPEFPPLNWAETRLFDTHGHFTPRMPVEKLVRMNRKCKTIFGVLAIEYIPNIPGGRSFLGDYPVYEAMTKYPDVIVGLGLIPASNRGFPGCPGSTTATVQTVEILHELGFRGLKTMEKWDPQAFLDAPAMTPVYRQAEKLRMPIVNHNNPPFMCMSGAGRIADQAAKQPSGISVVAHKTDDEEKHVANLREIPNLYWQHMHIGTSKRLAGLREAGVQRKIVFGTDIQESPTAHIAAGAKFAGNMRAAGWTNDEILWSSAGYALKWLDYPNTPQPV